MSAPLCTYYGVDVAKAELVLDLAGLILRFPNTKAGLTKLWARLVPVLRQGPGQLVCEASGGYERLLVATALARQIPISVAVPGRVRSFAKALGLRAKNDPIDAALLSRFGQATQPTPATPPDPLREHIAELLTQRSALLQQRLMADNRAEHHRSSLCQKQHRQLVALQLAALERTVRELLAQDQLLQQASQTLQSVSGVGPQTAATLLGYLPELGRVNRQRIAALAGLAPYDHDSGSQHGKRSIGGGRAPVRKILYMAALTAARHNPILKTAYASLLAKGKPAKLALTALARKLLVHLNSLLSLLFQNPSNFPLAA